MRAFPCVESGTEPVVNAGVVSESGAQKSEIWIEVTPSALSVPETTRPRILASNRP